MVGVWYEDEFYGKSEIYCKWLNVLVMVNQVVVGVILMVMYQGCVDVGFCYLLEMKMVLLSEVVVVIDVMLMFVVI